MVSTERPSVVTIREFAEADAEAVSLMWRQSDAGWPGGGPAGGALSTAARVREEQQELATLATFIAWEGDLAVGYLSLYPVPTDPTVAYVGVLSAHPAWHGRGVGRDLLRAALERAVALGYAQLDLHTWPGNMKAVPLYKKSGYFWEPDTTVHMQNFLPLIFQIPAAKRFFARADYYRDLRRDLIVAPDDEKLGNLDVYTYLWEHDGRRLRAVIDRHAGGLVALETESYAVSSAIDDRRVPVGGRRRATWQVSRLGPDPLQVAVLVEGEDDIVASLQASAIVEHEPTFELEVAARQPKGPPAFGRKNNRLRSTIVVDGEPVQLALGTEVCQPVEVSFERLPTLLPEQSAHVWIDLEGQLDSPLEGVLRLSATPGLVLEPGEISFDLASKGRASWQVEVRAVGLGDQAIRAQAHLRTPDVAEELVTRSFERRLRVGPPGEIAVDIGDTSVTLTAEHVELRAPLRPQRWMTAISLHDRGSGRSLLSSYSGVGPPFIPSALSNVVWTPRVERDDAGVRLTLSAHPDALPGITFERIVHLTPGGVVTLLYRATNTGSMSRTLTVLADTLVDLPWIETRLAAPLATGLIVDERIDLPDWAEAEMTAPERYAENWLASFGSGLVGATIWTQAEKVTAEWDTPSLRLALGEIAPGGRAETAPVYLYAGPGDWRTARALWRQLVAPDAPLEDPLPRPAHRVRLERFASQEDALATRVLLDSERNRAFAGRLTVEVDGREEIVAGVQPFRFGEPGALEVRLPMPRQAGAVPTALVFDHERAVERHAGSLIRVGGGGNVEVSADAPTVRVDNGRMRLVLAPGEMGRVVELTLDGGPNQLLASPDGPGVFVWFNPWYGGLHPVLYRGSDYDDGRYPGKLKGETFTWRELERTGSQGIHWRGVAVTTAPTTGDFAGVRLTVSYLTAARGNLLAMVMHLENASAARFEGVLEMSTFLQPGGDARTATLHFERNGLRNRKRVHGRYWSRGEPWLALTAANGAPGLAVVAAGEGARLQTRDLGLEGAHPGAAYRVDLAPGATRETVTYLAVVDDLAQARLYRTLAAIEALV